jgi:hypothetical protein
MKSTQFNVKNRWFVVVLDMNSKIEKSIKNQISGKMGSGPRKHNDQLVH